MLDRCLLGSLGGFSEPENVCRRVTTQKRKRGNRPRQVRDDARGSAPVIIVVGLDATSEAVGSENEGEAQGLFGISRGIASRPAPASYRDSALRIM